MYMLETNALSVSQVNFYIKSLFNSEDFLKNIFIVGEVSNLVTYNKSGHIYFSLKDEKSSIKAVIFSSIAKSLKFLPENGLKIIVRGSISVYEAGGTYQIYVNYVEPSGIGALNLAFEQLKNKLEKMGLFKEERKKPLPIYPKKIGVITSRSGAVLWDIQTTLKKRAPSIEIYFFPVIVQGKKASEEIISAINFFNALSDVEALIVARGGGSLEDLWSFNCEKLALAVAQSKIPIVSAVGHETDFTICDFVSDKRAATPTAAAEIISDGYFKANLKLSNYSILFKKHCKDLIFSYKYKLEKLKSLLHSFDPLNTLKNKIFKLEIYLERLNSLFLKNINKNKSKLLELKTKVESFNPKKIFDLGYALVLNEKNEVIKNSKNLKTEDTLNIRFLDSKVKCSVIEIDKV